MRRFVEGVGWGALIIAALLFFSLVAGGCASSMKSGCVTTPCGDTCCPNDGKVCPPCLEYSYNDGCNDCFCERVNGNVYSCKCTLVACIDEIPED